MLLSDKPTDKELLAYVEEFLSSKLMSQTAPAAVIARALRDRLVLVEAWMASRK